LQKKKKKTKVICDVMKHMNVKQLKIEKHQNKANRMPPTMELLSNVLNDVNPKTQHNPFG
jgi:hypothetical protein